jgi:hypothetical protein
LVSAFPTSGLHAQEFCQLHGLAPSTLRRNLKRAGALPAPAPQAPAPAGLEVVLAGGRRIAVGPGFDVATLGQLVRALEGL